MLSYLKPAPFKPEIQDKSVLDKAYKYWRIRIFYAMYIGYVFFYFTRKSFTFAMPDMVEHLGFSNKELGFVSTILYFTYGISKFTSGVLSDRSNPRYFMAIGLILTGIFNIFFGFTSSLILLGLFWGLNGWFQGWGWPAITKQLTYWYSQKERGLWWSVCSTSHNVGGAIIPFVVAQCVTLNFAGIVGWRYAMFIPGLMCIAIGCWLLNRLRDIPQTLGLPKIEVYKGELHFENDNESNDATRILTPRQILFDHVLNNKFIWAMALSYFFVYVVRTAINDWTVLYLVKELNYSRVAASGSIAWFEIGGFIGMLIAGWGSDVLFQGRRVPFLIFCGIGMAASIFAFTQLTAGSNIISCYILVALIGFFVFGPQMLIGLAAAEYVDKKAACTANGFVGCWAYVGAAATGYPLGAMIDISWSLYYWILFFCCVATIVILLPISYTSSDSASLSFNRDATSEG